MNESNIKGLSIRSILAFIIIFCCCLCFVLESKMEVRKSQQPIKSLWPRPSMLVYTACDEYSGVSTSALHKTSACLVHRGPSSVDVSGT